MAALIAPSLRQYALVTGNYWAFTLTDGALRMLVVLHFHSLGYNALQIAVMFIFYELFGVVTNLLGGFLGARVGLNRTMNIGLGLQLVALSMLLVNPQLLTIAWVMAAQAVSGVAKDLNKMSAKSAIKLLAPAGQSSSLYRWVALLTGSKNTLKGLGFFLGGALLTGVGFTTSILIMLIGLGSIWLLSLLLLKADLGRSKNKPNIAQLLSKSSTINQLSGARLFLFAARDVWFVVALPVYLAQQLSWTSWQVSTFLAVWIIVYGLVQVLAPLLTPQAHNESPSTTFKFAHNTTFKWQIGLALVPLIMAYGLHSQLHSSTVLVVGLGIFGFVFAVNSSLHSYLIVALAKTDSVALDVGFYYMANAAGRLLGTLLSGWVFLQFGFIACLLLSSALVLSAVYITHKLARTA
ncbi:organoarsenical effux MFS transporter ArsJ [Candidatus Njordibacter sp. Uisw_056]|jgi:MFS family permease|uniref:organoarsenical effux MFS transporter ArsJ n=1 Tax=Candidatus Njordibacter sp. Uisw_056 TaxID=3230973 RepID=UPI003D409219|tara:strand:+ start:842 stop:2065 length:1224 start_codon:yes stop_codon:yes gene_type:complete